MRKKKVLFICTHNSARSQMAEALLKHIAGNMFEVESAGFKAGVLNPLAVEVMREIDIDISRNETKSIWVLYRQGHHYDYVITVCSESEAAECPIFPGVSKQIHWWFADPASFQGTEEDKLRKTREIREQIRIKIEEWVVEICMKSATFSPALVPIGGLKDDITEEETI